MLNRTFFIVLAASLLISTSCLHSQKRLVEKDNSPESQPAAERNSTEEPLDNAQPNYIGNCSNEYYPIDNATVQQYKETGDVPNEFELSQKMIDENSFLEERKFKTGINVKVNWICTENGMRTAEYKSLGSFSLGNFKMETIDSSGVTLPKEWTEGKEFAATYKVKASVTAGTISQSASGTVTVTSKIVSLNDRVDVAGGEFDAAKVDVELKINLTMRGRRLPTRPARVSNWYAKDVGLVKQSATTQFGKTGIEYVGKK